jgi:hypothetical protein
MNDYMLRIRQASGPVPVRDAARALGLDTFIFYNLIQRDLIPYEFAADGEVVVTADDVLKLAIKKEVS